ncbi:hypothetical protein [uncultured Bacteroides sp.]|uniref:hypothetical protein n=1 Tax=uncultured Bacteroides sp. TaxID=162156 RepID=UPI0025E14BAF|nr:hypothetical protein [uncultured Bacteroides sp.]
MGESRITEKDLLDRGYIPTESKNKYTKTIDGKDIELIPNGKGVIPKVKNNNSPNNNSKIDTPQYKQMDNPKELDEFEDYIKSK